MSPIGQMEDFNICRSDLGRHRGIAWFAGCIIQPMHGCLRSANEVFTEPTATLPELLRMQTSPQNIP